jgi:hypothetical protein
MYILVVIDCFTRFVELYPLVSTGAEEAARQLAIHCGRYGTPLQIQSDGGSQFVNEVVHALSDLLGTQQITTVAYSKQENAIVERSNKEVMRHLRAYLFDNKVLEGWVDYLPACQRIINSTPHSSIGVSPAQLLFGNAVTLDRNLYNLPSDVPSGSSTSASTTMRAWIDKTMAVQSRLISIAQKLQAEKDEDHLKSLSSGEEVSSYKVGSYVLVKYPDSGMGNKPPTKLHTPWRGPFKVVNAQGSTYTVQNLISQQCMTLHVSMLKEFVYDPQHTDPQNVALADKQHFIVEKVLEHYGNPKRLRSLFFKVKWVGFERTTRESYNLLRDNEVLHDYLRKTPKLRSIIPKKYVNQARQAEASRMDVEG